MSRYAQLVVGPAGSGKSTYISAMLEHAEASKRSMFAVNLDPAAEVFNYQPAIDIRELVHVDDVMEDPELGLGPNGGLVYAMEYMMENVDWLAERLGNSDDDYVLFDTPGQIELVSHFDLMKKFVKFLEKENFRVCVVFLLDSQFVSDLSKYFSSLMVSLITLINLELPVVNILSKVDKIPNESRKFLDELLEPGYDLLQQDIPNFDGTLTINSSDKYQQLSRAFARVIDDYSLQKFMPLSVLDEELINDVLAAVDRAIQFGENADVQTMDYEF